MDEQYSQKLRSIGSNLQNPMNRDLRMKLVKGEVKPESLSTMTNEELAPEEVQKERQEREEKFLK